MTPKDLKTQYYIKLLLILLVCLALLPTLGSLKLMHPSEGYYAEGAREMLESGNYITPTLNYQSWFDKPILCFWLIALSYKLFGINEFASRLPAALSAGILVYLTYVVVNSLVGKRSALLSAVVLLSSPLFLVVGHLSLTDMPYTLFTSSAMLCFALALIGKEQHCVWFGYSLLALAMLCKGPLAIVFTALTVLVYLAITENSFAKFCQTIQKLKVIPGIILFLAIATPWYVMVHQETQGAFTQDFFLHQNLGRLYGTVPSHHNPSWWFYALPLLGGFFPWSLWLAGLSKLLLKAWQRRTKSNRYTKLLLFSSSWALVVLGILSAVPTKLFTYLVPVLPALAIALGIYIDILLRLNKSRPLSYILPLLGISGIVISIALLVFKPLYLFSIPLLVIIMAFSVALLILYFVMHYAFIKAATQGLIAVIVVSCLILVPMGLSSYYAISQVGLIKLIEKVQANNANLASLVTGIPIANYYLKRRIHVITTPKQMLSYLASPPSPHWFLVPADVQALLSWSPKPITLIAKERRWHLYKLQDE